MKYRALPGISPPKTPTGRDGRRASGLPCAVSDDRRSLASSPAGERKTRPSSGQSVLSDSTIYEPPPPPEPFQLFVAILARTYLPDEFQALFTGYGWFFRERRPMGGSINEDNQALSDSSQRSIISSTLSSILDDVMQDPEVQGLPDVMRLEPLPYFAQISTRKANGIVLENEGQEENDVGEGVENKEQGGERISGDHGSGKGTDEVAVGVEESVKDVGASAESPEIGGQKENDFEEKDAWLLSSSEFHALVETVIEGTIYNIVQEANAGEFEITRHHMAIVQ
ncbi:hypothetical protein HK104_000021 [Borealophlyctis nickersoniae]|nr:hypothetical protein HK104_000021 [Borealophlyctis nickersoniae]